MPRLWRLRKTLGGDVRKCLTLNKNFTLNFPTYPSGHMTFGAAAFHITRLFYGVKIGNRKAATCSKGSTSSLTS